jgi:hypothetical protein
MADMQFIADLKGKKIRGKKMDPTNFSIFEFFNCCLIIIEKSNPAQYNLLCRIKHRLILVKSNLYFFKKAEFY